MEESLLKQWFDLLEHFAPRERGGGEREIIQLHVYDNLVHNKPVFLEE